MTTYSVTPNNRAVRYDDIYWMDEIKSLSFHIMFYRLRGVAKYIVYGNIFWSFEWLRSLYTPPPPPGREGETERPQNQELTRDYICSMVTRF